MAKEFKQTNKKKVKSQSNPNLIVRLANLHKLLIFGRSRFR